MIRVNETGRAGFRDFFVTRRQTRTEFAHRADVRLAASLEKEKVRNYFLGNNDGWQMQTLTRHVQEDEDRQRQQKADAEADKVREGDVVRQGEEKISLLRGKIHSCLRCFWLITHLSCWGYPGRFCLSQRVWTKAALHSVLQTSTTGT